MIHKKIRIPREKAIDIMRALGNLNNSIQFDDLTKNNLEAQTSFNEIIKRCDVSIKKIKDFINISKEFNIGIENYSEYGSFTFDLEKDMLERDKKYGSDYFDLIESEVNENDRKLKELSDSHGQIREDLVNLIEKKHVLKKTQFIISPDFSEIDAGEDGIKQSSNVNFLAGVVDAEHELKMRRMLFRITRGRDVTAFYPLDVDLEEYAMTSSLEQKGDLLGTKRESKEEGRREVRKLNSFIQGIDMNKINTKKKIFTIIFPGGEEGILLGKVLKVCEIFHVSRYPVPKRSKINSEISNIESEISEKKTLLNNIEKNIEDLILVLNVLRNKRFVKYSFYRLFFEQEKLIYLMLNKCILHENFLDGEVWIPENKLLDVENCLKNISKDSDHAYLSSLTDIIREHERPPTYIKINEFTSSFQLVVNTYGIPRYQEINPGFFTIVSFPFLFGVMFGDIGHGTVLLLLGIYLWKNYRFLKKSIFNPLLQHRYFIILMGFFAIFCGLLYNDFFGIPIDFTSCYLTRDPEMPQKKSSKLNKIDGCFNRFGLDSVWMVASNELTFVNSLKMKLSVILGVAQMLLGIILSGLNSLYMGNLVDFLFVFLPQMILMFILFGYMDFLIFVKWNIDYTGKEYIAPDIKSYLMNIFLSTGKLPTKPIPPGQLEPTPEDPDWELLASREKMEKLHAVILVSSIICCILMFLPKVIIEHCRSMRKFRQTKFNQKENNVNLKENINNLNNGSINDEITVIKEGQNKDEDIPRFSDILVNQVIECIEFILGTVSNTASYLRLWALSLAHSQLSIVFLSKTIIYMGTVTSYFFVNGLFLSVTFLVFATITIVVLLFMDMMECFLHTLRLHWVEFQNKFYKADGYEYKPFCFKRNLNLDEENE